MKKTPFIMALVASAVLSTAGNTANTSKPGRMFPFFSSLPAPIDAPRWQSRPVPGWRKILSARRHREILRRQRRNA
jgi:hypothetical protein